MNSVTFTKKIKLHKYNRNYSIQVRVVDTGGLLAYVIV